MIDQIVFYVLALVLLASGAMVVTSRNPVHSVLFLILAFFNAAGLFLLAGAEFLAMILVIVYVGAIAVLFLFVVMMLDVNFVQLREGFQRYTPVGAAVGVVLFAELVLVVDSWHVAPGVASGVAAVAPALAGMSNTAALGTLIYTRYVLLFQGAGLVLLVAMMGAIVLTHRERRASRRQDISVQVARRADETLDMVDIPLGGAASVGFNRRAAALPFEPPIHDAVPARERPDA